MVRTSSKPVRTLYRGTNADLLVDAARLYIPDGVVVVDSHSKPSAAQALYRDIQGLTKQPIRKVINTHFHWDHWQGNQAYAAQTPHLEIITSESTKENMTKPDAGAGGLSYIEKQLVNVPKEIEQLKNDMQQASSPEQKARLEANLQQAEAYLDRIGICIFCFHPTRSWG